MSESTSRVAGSRIAFFAATLLIFCSGQIGALSIDESIVLKLNAMNPMWVPQALPFVHVKFKDGIAANDVRLAPHEFQVCVTGGMGATTCKPLLQTGEFPAVSVALPIRGGATLRGWVQHHSFPASPSRAVGSSLSEMTLKVNDFLRWTSTVERCNLAPPGSDLCVEAVEAAAGELCGDQISNSSSSPHGAPVRSCKTLLASFAESSRAHSGGPSVARVASALCSLVSGPAATWAECAGPLWAGHSTAETSQMLSLYLNCDDHCSVAGNSLSSHLRRGLVLGEETHANVHFTPLGHESRTKFFFELSASWWPLVLQEVDWSQRRRVLEIGAFEGGSTRWLMRYLTSAHPDSELVVLDMWSPESLHKAAGFAEATTAAVADDVFSRFKATACAAGPGGGQGVGGGDDGNRSGRGAVRLLAGDSFESLVQLLSEQQQQQQPSGGGELGSEGEEDRQFDLVYVDGGHEGGTPLSDGLLGFRLLREGGFLIFDDVFVDPPEGWDAVVGAGVEGAVDSLLAAYGPSGLLELVSYSPPLTTGAPQVIFRKGRSSSAGGGRAELNARGGFAPSSRPASANRADGSNSRSVREPSLQCDDSHDTRWSR